MLKDIWTAHFKRLNCRICEFHLNKVTKKPNEGSEVWLSRFASHFNKWTSTQPWGTCFCIGPFVLMYNEHNNESYLRGPVLRSELTHVKRLQWYLAESKHLINANYHNYSLSLFIAGHTAPWPSLPGWAGVVKLLLKGPASPGLCTCPSTPSLLTPFPEWTSIYPSSLNWNIISFRQTSLTGKVRLITLNIMFPWHLVLLLWQVTFLSCKW